MCRYHFYFCFSIYTIFVILKLCPYGDVQCHFIYFLNQKFVRVDHCTYYAASFQVNTKSDYEQRVMPSEVYYRTLHYGTYIKLSL